MHGTCFDWAESSWRCFDSTLEVDVLFDIIHFDLCMTIVGFDSIDVGGVGGDVDVDDVDGVGGVDIDGVVVVKKVCC